MMNDDAKSNATIRNWQDPFGQALAEFNRRSPMSEKPRDTGATIGGQR
jgi:hypothetical protein